MFALGRALPGGLTSLQPRGGSGGSYVATFRGLALKKEAFRRLWMVASEGEKDGNPRQAGFSGGLLIFPGVLEGDGAVEFSGVLQVCDKITVTLELEALARRGIL